jgi:glyoxylase I family protein
MHDRGMTILGLDHVVLRVTDLGRALAFYCGALGCTEERRLAELGLVQLRAGRSLIDLIDVSAPLGKKGGGPAGREGRNMDHFCVRIDPFDEAAIRAHLQRHGVEVGVVEQRYGADGMGPSLYIEDPDGNVVELKGPASG